jgi:hypothetical protein
MSLHRKQRVLVVGEGSYLWTVGHRHTKTCEEVLSIRRVGAPSRRTLCFENRPGFVIPVGGLASAAGVITDDADQTLNLNEPGTVRAFVDVLVASEWPATDRRAQELDGWLWFGEAYRLRMLRTPAAATAAPETASPDTASPA